MTTPNQKPVTSRRAAAFDIRNFIGSLLGLYGIILTVMGIFGDAELQKTGGLNANLWAGLLLLIVGGCFLAWARIRPIPVMHHGDTDAAPRRGH